MMKAFDSTEYDTLRKQYEDEVRERWGDTSAYEEHRVKMADYSKEKWNSTGSAINAILARFAGCMSKGFSPSSQRAQELVRELQEYITENMYTCTKEILTGLGRMYTADERFRKNIDRHGEGTAEYISKVIEVYCV